MKEETEMNAEENSQQEMNAALGQVVHNAINSISDLADEGFPESGIMIELADIGLSGMKFKLNLGVVPMDNEFNHLMGYNVNRNDIN